MFCRIMFVLALVFTQAVYAEEISYREEILAYSEMELPHVGTLKRRPSTGLIYLDVSDDYIRQLIKFVEADGFLESDCLDGPDKMGAHISVISGKESRSLESVDELELAFSFTITDCIKVHPPTWKAVEEVYILVVEAPELDEVRQRYGLPKKPHAFHITFGLKPKI